MLQTLDFNTILSGVDSSQTQLYEGIRERYGPGKFSTDVTYKEAFLYYMYSLDEAVNTRFGLTPEAVESVKDLDLE